MAIDVKLTLKDEASRVYNQFVGNVNKQAATLDNTMKSVGTAIGAAFSIGAIASFMKTAAAANAEVTRMDQALQNSGLSQYRTELLETAKALRDKTAVDDDEIVKLQAQLVAYTGNIDAVRALTPAVLDLAAGTGMSVEAAGKLVGKSREGVEGLKRLGITIGETTTDEERLAKITEEVSKRYGGMAEAFGKTDAGGIQKLSNAMEDLQETAGNVFLKILKPILPGILTTFEAIGWTIDKMVGGLRVGVAVIMTAIIRPLAQVEELLNVMGITSSKNLQNFRDTGYKLISQYSNDLMKGSETANTALKTTGTIITETDTKFVSMKDDIKNLNGELDKLNPGTAAYATKLKELNIAQTEYNHKVQESMLLATTQSTVFNTKTIPALQSIVTGYSNIKLKQVEVSNNSSIVFDGMTKDVDVYVNNMDNNINNFASIFTSSLDVILEKNGNTVDNLKSLWDNFFRSLRNQMIEISAQQLALSAMTGGEQGSKKVGGLFGTIIGSVFGGPVGGAVGGVLGGLLGFDGGGGAFFDAPRNTATPILIHGQEKIKVTTPEQERTSGGGGNNFTLNFNAPGTSEDMVYKALKKLVRDTGMTIEALTASTNSKLVFS